MKTRNGKINIRTLTLAVHAALVGMVAMPANAQDESAANLKAPTSYVELGGLYVNTDSAKFGEYTGLNKKGGYAIGNADVRGGSAYGPGDGTQRWQVWGSDLGTTSRAAGANFADQGRWNIGLVYDELVHYTSDSYQTPYEGKMGGNQWTLSGFGLVNSAAPGTRALSATQLAQFHNVDVSNKRENLALTAGLILDRRWSVKLDYNRLDQSGAKLMGFGSAQFAVANAPTGERVAILPMPTNYTTDTVNAALNWLGENSNATLSYFGSFFHDRYNGVNFQTFVGSTVTETMGTAPSNNLHQLNLTGGYALSQRTKLAGGLSYSYNTQNTAYAYDTAAMVTASPTSSLNGSVRNTHADLKLTDQTTRDLILSGGLKYDYRDNRTASNIYNFRSIDGGNIANYPNAPLSFKKWQAELAGDYRLSRNQKVRLAYTHDDIHRECNNYATGGGTPAYAPGTDCVTVPNTKENKLGVAWRIKAAEGVNLNAGYSYSDRKSDRDLNARPPMIGRDGNPTAAGIAAAPPGITGLNGGEFIGFNPFFEASRKQNMLKGGANWEATDRVSVGFSGRVTDDKYDTDFGMQKGKSWGLNLDGTYAYTENGSLTAYATRQQRTRNMTNEQRSPLSVPGAASATAVAIPAGATWNNELKDSDTTVGIGAKHGGFFGGRLELKADATYTWARTSFNTTLDYSTTTTGGLTCADPSIFTCVATPDITSSLFRVNVAGLYQLTRSSKVSLGVLHQRLKSDDFYYNGLQSGFTPTGVLPTNQSAPNYSLNVVYASYIYTF